jgi:hypothetical protein
MPITEAMNHYAVQTYLRELATLPAGAPGASGLKRTRLLTLLSRAKTMAKEQGWPPTD